PNRLQPSVTASVRSRHLACGGQDRVLGVELGDGAPAPAGLLLVEGLLWTPLAERDDVHGLEKLVIVLAHEAFAAGEDIEFHALERETDLDGVGGFRLVDGGRQHAHLIEGPRIDDRDTVLVAKGLLGRLRGRVIDVGGPLLDGKYTMIQAGLLDGG